MYFSPGLILFVSYARLPDTFLRDTVKPHLYSLKQNKEEGASPLGYEPLSRDSLVVQNQGCTLLFKTEPLSREA